MGNTIKLKKGFDINIKGKPQKTLATDFTSRTFAIKPTDFRGIAPIPKMLVEVGDHVKAGEPLFFDKQNPDIKFVASVSGEITEIKRGAKRAINEVIIVADSTIQFRPIEKVAINQLGREGLIQHMMTNGCWPFLTQRPYGTLADPQETPKAIFISGFDSAPLATDYNFAVVGLKDYLQTGIDVLSILSGGKVHLSLNGNTQNPSELTSLSKVETHSVSGPHPAGNVGIQIHHIDAINKGDIVWTIKLQDLIALGRVYKDGQFNTERFFAVGGPRVKNPQYFKSYIGANIEHIAKNNLTDDHVRFIGGNVLDGTKMQSNGHMGFYKDAISVIEEGDKYEMFGWIWSNYPKPSASKAFFSSLFGGKDKEFDVNTNTHGEKRALVVTGQYEKVLPMDLYPMQLIKAIMFGDLDQMEGLGLYEVLEEDLALCEFVCTSKNPVQKVLREGLDMMREQG